jgi:transcription antitermination factor NusG
MALIPGRWYALQVRTRHEVAVELRLRQSGYNVCLPRTATQRAGSTGACAPRTPLFPGYVFTQYDPAIAYRMVEAPGVIRIVGFGSTPTPVDEAELESARILADSGAPVGACSFVREGEAVTIREGPLAGLHGVVSRIKGHHRIVVQMFLLQRAVFADLDDAALGQPLAADMKMEVV